MQHALSLNSFKIILNKTDAYNRNFNKWLAHKFSKTANYSPYLSHRYVNLLHFRVSFKGAEEHLPPLALACPP